LLYARDIITKTREHTTAADIQWQSRYSGCTTNSQIVRRGIFPSFRGKPRTPYCRMW